MRNTVNPTEQGLIDPQNWNTLNDAIDRLGQTFANTLQAAFPPKSATVYVGHQVTLTENSTVPVSILGFDLSRSRALLIASLPGVFIGDRNQLNDFGFIIPTAGPAEIKTTEEVFAIYKNDTPTGIAATLSIWVEKWAE